jgi:hypothetical protein
MPSPLSARPSGEGSGAERTLVVLQPGYLPWLGFFDQMRRSDVFVYYDDVQFDKGGWRNRNRIKCPDGPRWLTVPVKTKGRHPQRILEVEINNRQTWASDHLGSLRHCYSRAPYLDRYLPELEELLDRQWDLLVELDIALIGKMAQWLGLSPTTMRSSKMEAKGSRTERLLELALELEATTYLSGNAAQDYLDVELMAEHHIEVRWHNYEHPTYPQLHGPFMPYLSAIDLLLNCGEESAIILSGKEAG